ncbi:MAG: hypothetical protein NVSMB49_14480 [Ktedonobacteraceae bacterium]
MIWGHMHEAHSFLPFIFLFGLSRLLWLALLGILVWSLIRWVTTRGRHWNQPLQYTPGTPYTMHREQPFGGPPVPGARPDEPLHQPSALEILSRRYANGEIDAATYENMRERILGSQEPGQQQSM